MERRQERNVAECSVADGGVPGGRERGVFERPDPHLGFWEKGFGEKERFTSFGLKCEFGQKSEIGFLGLQSTFFRRFNFYLFVLGHL